MRKHRNVLGIVTAVIMFFSVHPANLVFAQGNMVTWLVPPTLEFSSVDPAGFAFDGYARVAVPDKSTKTGERWIYINEKGEQQAGYTDEKVMSDIAMRTAETMSKKPDDLDDLHSVMWYLGYDIELTPECDNPENFWDRKCGYKDKNGKLVIAAEYSVAEYFRNGFARVEKFEGNERKIGFIDKTGKVVVPLIYTNANAFFTEGLVGVVKDNRSWGFVDETGAVVIPFFYSSRNNRGNSLSPDHYDDGFYFADGLCVVGSTNHGAGVINKNNAVVFGGGDFGGGDKSAGYLEITEIKNNLALVLDENFKWGIVKFDATAANYKPPATVASEAKPVFSTSVADVKQDVSSPAVNQTPTTPQAITVRMNEGTQIRVTSSSAISTQTARVGDKFQAVLSDDITSDGRVIARRGSVARGVISESDGGSANGVAAISLQLTGLMLADGHEVSIKTDEHRAEIKVSAASSAAKAVAGAALGGLLGGGRGAARGAAAGSAAGNTPAVIAAETPITFNLSESLDVVLK